MESMDKSSKPEGSPAQSQMQPSAGEWRSPSGLTLKEWADAVAQEMVQSLREQSLKHKTLEQLYQERRILEQSKN